MRVCYIIKKEVGKLQKLSVGVGYSSAVVDISSGGEYFFDFFLDKSNCIVYIIIVYINRILKLKGI